MTAPERLAAILDAAKVEVRPSKGHGYSSRWVNLTEREQAEIRAALQLPERLADERERSCTCLPLPEPGDELCPVHGSERDHTTDERERAREALRPLLVELIAAYRAKADEDPSGRMSDGLGVAADRADKAEEAIYARVAELLRAAPPPAEQDDEFGPVTITEADRVRLAASPPAKLAYEHPEQGLTCNVGGCRLRIVSSDEGTSYYEPVVSPPAEQEVWRLDGEIADVRGMARAWMAVCELLDELGIPRFNAKSARAGALRAIRELVASPMETEPMGWLHTLTHREDEGGTSVESWFEVNEDAVRRGLMPLDTRVPLFRRAAAPKEKP